MFLVKGLMRGSVNRIVSFTNVPGGEWDIMRGVLVSKALLLKCSSACRPTGPPSPRAAHWKADSGHKLPALMMKWIWYWLSVSIRITILHYSLEERRRKFEWRICVFVVVHALCCWIVKWINEYLYRTYQFNSFAIVQTHDSTINLFHYNFRCVFCMNSIHGHIRKADIYLFSQISDCGCEESEKSINTR